MQGNKKLIVYVITYGPKSTRFLLKFQKSSAPGKYTTSKFSTSLILGGSYSGYFGMLSATAAILVLFECVSSS